MKINALLGGLVRKGLDQRHCLCINTGNVSLYDCKEVFHQVTKGAALMWNPTEEFELLNHFMTPITSLNYALDLFTVDKILYEEKSIHNFSVFIPVLLDIKLTFCL